MTGKNAATLFFMSMVMLFGQIRAASAASPGAGVRFVSPQWVAENASAPDVRILDVRPNVYDYFAGHAPNAVHLADASLRAPLLGIPAQYLQPKVAAELLSRAGVKRSDRIIVYSSGADVLGATMTAYVLERLGHKDVAIVDGGWEALKEAKLTSQEYPTYSASTYQNGDDTSVRVTFSDLKSLMGRKDVTFVDARPSAAYRGEVTTWMRNGHIPGAINVEWRSLVDENNPHKLKPVDEIRKIFAARGLTPDSNVVLYCGTSREASLEFIVLKHLLGFSKARLYEGSWAEYSAHSELKVETGPDQAH